VIQTTDHALIRSFLEDESVIDGFSDGKRIENLNDALYLYDEGVGIFPVRIRDRVASIHAAIPEKNRGTKALKSAKDAVTMLILLGYTVVARVRYNDKKTRAFVNMVGFSLIGSKDEFKLYRYI